MDTVANIRVEDPIRQARAAVFSAWAKELQPEIGYQTKELIKAAEFCAGTERAHPALWDALFAIASPRTGYQTIDANTLGRWLRDNLDTISAGHKLTVDRSDAARPRWKLQREGARLKCGHGGHCGHCGHLSTPPHPLPARVCAPMRTRA